MRAREIRTECEALGAEFRVLNQDQHFQIRYDRQNLNWYPSTGTIYHSRFKKSIPNVYEVDDFIDMIHALIGENNVSSNGVAEEKTQGRDVSEMREAEAARELCAMLCLQ